MLQPQGKQSPWLHSRNHAGLARPPARQGSKCLEVGRESLCSIQGSLGNDTPGQVTLRMWRGIAQGPVLDLSWFYACFHAALTTNGELDCACMVVVGLSVKVGSVWQVSGSFAALAREELEVCHDNMFPGSQRCHKPAGANWVLSA